MPQLLISHIDEISLNRLKERALKHGRTAELEACEILADVLRTTTPDPWAVVDAVRTELAATGREFGDSTELIREDRAR